MTTLILDLPIKSKKGFDPANPTPGIYNDFTIHEYHRGPLKGIISKSYLVKHLECPAATQVPDEDSEDKQTGRAMHPWILEGKEIFDRDFAVMPEFPCPPEQNPRGWKSTNVYKALKATWEADHIGREIISQDQFQKILGMERGVKGNPYATKIIQLGIPELTMIWQDTDCVMPDGTIIQGTGLWVKSRPDITIAIEAGIDFVDLKKSQKIKRHAFQGSVLQFGYHVQAAMAFEGMWRLTGKAAKAFTFIAVRDKAPWQCEIYPIGGSHALREEDGSKAIDDPLVKWLSTGIKHYHKFLAFEVACRKENYWPNYELIYEPPFKIDLHRPKLEELDIPGYLTPEQAPWEAME